jgi:hypothetical protein
MIQRNKRNVKLKGRALKNMGSIGMGGDKY